MDGLKRAMTLPGLTLLAAGACIGSGIFMTPNDVAAEIGRADWILAAWCLGGVISLTGALSYAELGAMFPQAGGVYVYIREAMGKLPAFLYGWVFLTVINTGALAGLGIGLTGFLGYYIEMSAFAQMLTAITVIISLSLINVLGINVSQWLISGLTTIKILVLIAIVFLALSLGETPTSAIQEGALRDFRVSGFFAALVGVLWSFGGWYHATFLAGETRDPQRTVPRALVMGVLLVTVVYVGANWAYMKSLSMDTLIGSERVAADAVGAILPVAGKVVSAMVILSIIGTISIYTMSAPRIYFAMARDGIFFKALARIHPQYRTPHVAIIVQAILAVVLLLLWKTFANLITYVTFIDMVFLLMGGVCLFIFRRTLADRERPFRLPLAPVITGFFLLTGTAFVISVLIERPIQSIAGLAVLASGVLVYYVYRAYGAGRDQEAG